MIVPQAPRREPRIGQALLWARCMAFLVCRDLRRRLQTFVSARRDRVRPVRSGWPTRHHLDNGGPRLSYADEAELALLDTETVAELPMDLRVALTSNLTSTLASLTSRRRTR
jgi:hypothetical protein